MTRDDARLRLLLEEERVRLEAELSYFDSIEYDDIGAGNHLADEGSAAFDQASDMALRRQAEHRLARVDRALQKFTDATYGYCEGCGEPIDFARLKALPDARFCLDCQRKREVSGAPPAGPRALEQHTLHIPKKKDSSV